MKETVIRPQNEPLPVIGVKGAVEATRPCLTCNMKFRVVQWQTAGVRVTHVGYNVHEIRHTRRTEWNVFSHDGASLGTLTAESADDALDDARLAYGEKAVDVVQRRIRHDD